MKHTFAVAAYKESPYLDDAVCSLVNQNLVSEVIICTSTPNKHIESIASKYSLGLFVRDGSSSITDDWNFCVETAVHETGADLVTIAHQDDIYEGNYSRALMMAAARYPDMSLFCTGFRVIDCDGRVIRVSYEKVKKLLMSPLRLKKLAHLSFVKRLPLAYGNAVCAPSCTYNTKLTGLPLFEDKRYFVPDWLTLIRLSGMPGRFVYNKRKLIDYRVHKDAETMLLTKGHLREKEEYEVFCSLHTRPAARVLMHFYKRAYSAYDPGSTDV